MLWLKRNLVLVAAIVAGVVLAALGGFFVWTKYSLNQELDQKLGQAKEDLRRVAESKPSPTPENVEAANRDLKAVTGFVTSARLLFAPTPYQPLNSQTYRSLLETTVADLRRLAQQSGVDLSSNYNFSFEAQIHKVSFEQTSLKPLSEQLTEITSISKVLLKAKVHHLELIRRVACSEYDAQNATEIFPGGGFQTNRVAGMVVWPYEFTFDCFSGNLATVLSELSQVPRMMLVKTISVQPSPATTATLGGASSGPAPPVVAVPVTAPARRQPGRGAQPGAAVAKSTELKTALEEKLLRVVILIHLVKPGG